MILEFFCFILVCFLYWLVFFCFFALSFYFVRHFFPSFCRYLISICRFAGEGYTKTVHLNSVANSNDLLLLFIHLTSPSTAQSHPFRSSTNSSPQPIFVSFIKYRLFTLLFLSRVSIRIYKLCLWVFFKRRKRKRRKEKRKWLLSVAGEIECKIIWNKHRSCFNRPCSSNGRNFLSDLLPSVPISRRLLPIWGFTVILDGSRSIQKRINTRWIKIFEAERAEQRFLSPWKKREQKE